MCNCTDQATPASDAREVTAARGGAAPVFSPSVPLARLVDLAPDPHDAPGPGMPSPASRPCRLDFRSGCYVITHQPTGALTSFQGTLRVDRGAPGSGPDRIIVSGDLYTRRPGVDLPVA